MDLLARQDAVRAALKPHWGINKTSNGFPISPSINAAVLFDGATWSFGEGAARIADAHNGIAGLAQDPDGHTPSFIASCSKIFTSLLAHWCHQEGHIDLDTPILDQPVKILRNTISDRTPGY